MWEAVCAGIVAVNLCIDPCATMVLLALTALVIVLLDPPEKRALPPPTSRDDVSARIATTEEEREMVENPRRFVAAPKQATQKGYARTNESHKRLWDALRNEMSNRPHQFANPRLFRKEETKNDE